MSSSTQPIVGNGRVQWDFLGWFGTILGSTVWMVVATVSLIQCSQVILAIVPLACFLLVNSVAIYLWKRRDRLPPFQSLVQMMVLISLSISIVCGTISVCGSKDVLNQLNWPKSRFLEVGVHFLGPALILWLYYLEHRHIARRKGTEGQSTNAT